jgi:hypothetical protein
MTAKADFTGGSARQCSSKRRDDGDDAAHAGTFWETFAAGKAYAEAGQQHGESEPPDQIISAEPEIDRARYHSVEKKAQGVHHRDAVEVLNRTATADELGDSGGHSL